MNHQIKTEKSGEEAILSKLDSVKRIVIKVFFFLFPLFFLPFFVNTYTTAKIVLTAVAALLILLINLVKVVITKKLHWRNSYLQMGLLIFLATQILTLLLKTPNKFQALYVGPESLVFLISMIIIVLNAISLQISVFPVLTFSSAILALSIILSFLNVFNRLPLPENLQFMKSPYFNPVGSYLESLLLIGFFTIISLIKLFRQQENNNRERIFLGIGFALFLISLTLGIYNIVNPVEVNGQKFRIILPPLRISWYAAVEILKDPLTALFGVGFNNFASIFTKVKTLDYNLSDLWQISSFDLSASTLLHIFTVSGILGFLAFAYLLINLYRKALEKEDNISILSFIFLLLILISLPLSLTTWLLFFSLIIEIDKPTKEYILNIGQIPLVYLSTIGVYLLLLLGASYFLTKYVRAEVFFYLANQAIAKNDGNKAFEYHRRAIQEFPYKEEFRLSFSRLNLLIAQNLINQIQEKSQQEKPDEQEINDLRQNLNQTIQLAIDEAKAAVALNSQRADNWAFLANVYRNILFLAQGADTWAISTYRRAIQLDPLNPIYNLNLAGIFYSLQNYNEAEKAVETTIAAKPDWPNAYYNMAWTAYQKGDYQKAVQMMQTTLNLLDPQRDKQDYERAQKELEEFKKKLPKEETTESTPEGQTQQPQENLSIPTPPQTQTQEKIELPKEASPEAQ